jgi:hypothetical protein
VRIVYCMLITQLCGFIHLQLNKTTHLAALLQFSNTVRSTSSFPVHALTSQHHAQSSALDAISLLQSLVVITVSVSCLRLRRVPALVLY